MQAVQRSVNVLVHFSNSMPSSGFIQLSPFSLILLAVHTDGAIHTVPSWRTLLEGGM